MTSWWRRWFGRPEPTGIDVGALAMRHLLRGHKGHALLCQECVEAGR